MATPLLVVFVGPNGAGKTTLRNLLFSDFDIPFVNADLIAADLGIDSYRAAEIAKERRLKFVEEKKSFMFETVLSDPVGEKVQFLQACRDRGYHVIVNFIGLASPEHSRARVIQRVHEGGHDVPDDKIAGRYPRIIDNLKRLLGTVDVLTIYDNTSASTPYRVLARFQGKAMIELAIYLPNWVSSLGLESFASPETIRVN